MEVSHERCGTHFLMNALAACYGYVSAPRVNLGLPTVNSNSYYPPRARDTPLSLAARPIANVVQSHHPADFFAAELPRLTERYDQAEGGRQGVEAAVAAAGVGDGGADVAKGQRTQGGPPGRGNSPPHLPKASHLAKIERRTALTRHGA